MVMRAGKWTFPRLTGGLAVMRGPGFLPPGFSPLCYNVDFRKDSIYGCLGRQLLHEDEEELDGELIGLYSYTKHDGSAFVIAHTTTKAYYYDSTAEASPYWVDISDTTYNGSVDYPVSAAVFTDLYIWTNWKDTIRSWDGTSATASALGGSPPYAKFLLPWKNRLMIAYTNESGTDCPYRVRWSDAGDATSWPADNFIDLVEEQGLITGMVQLLDNLFVFTDRNIHVLSAEGDLFPSAHMVFLSYIGCVAPFSIAAWRNTAVFLAEDGVYAFDGSNIVDISQETVKDIILGIDGTYRHRAVGVVVPELDQYWLAIPDAQETLNEYTEGQNNLVLVYDFQRKAWSAKTMMPVQCFSRVVSAGGTTIGQLVGTIEEQVGMIGDYGLTISKRLLGGFAGDGHVYELNAGDTDAGSTLTRYWSSDWLDLGAEGINKLLLRIEVYAKSIYPREGTLTLTVYKDYGSTAVATEEIDLSSDTADEVVGRLDCKLTGKVFKITLACTTQFEVHRIVFYGQPKTEK